MSVRRVWDEGLGLWVIVRDGLGTCDTCGRDVRGGTECSDCLENAGVVRHDRCCTLPFGGIL